MLTALLGIGNFFVREWDAHSFVRAARNVNSTSFATPTNITASIHKHGVAKHQISKDGIPTATDVLSSKKWMLSTKMFVGRKFEKKKNIPIVMIALNMHMNHVLTKTIPVLCSKNDRVVFLTNKKQKFQMTAQVACLEIVDISYLYNNVSSEMPWPRSASANQKVFFQRWYVLREWMRKTGVHMIFTMDSDAVMTQNITRLVFDNLNTIEEHEMWLFYIPPRSSIGCFLTSLAALEDITKFWNRLFLPDIWTSEFVTGTSPNDMIALGHYIHNAVGKPYPCWGFGPGRKDGSCDGSIDYGYTKILERLSLKGVKTKFSPGTLALNKTGQATLSAGVFDLTYTHDPLQRYEMKNGMKQLRFLKGTPQFKLRSGSWITLWGYILEDAMEKCVDSHLKSITLHKTCVCLNFCCIQC